MYVYLADCCACHRRSSACTPAPDTPPEEVVGNLYCPDCHRDGRAVYKPVKLVTFSVAEHAPGGVWLRPTGAALLVVGGLLVAAGLLAWALARR